MKTIVITGSSRGIGRGLAHEFLKRECRVVVSSRTQEVIERVCSDFAEYFGKGRVTGISCDITDWAQVQALWNHACSFFGSVDVWINNAGIANTTRMLWELESSEISRVVSTNLTGVMYGTQVALQGMLKQGSGQVYNVEGFGSNDLVVKGLSVYGATKRAVRYFSESMALELEGQPVQCGMLSPGIVLTDFLVEDMRKMPPEQLEATKAVYNVLADDVETVTDFLAEELLVNTENGRRIEWLTDAKANTYFADEARASRDLFSQYGL
jgi:NAD(P)-dependent dehydrogenase (short-subunit alcohol dehydrogenase family)